MRSLALALFLCFALGSHTLWALDGITLSSVTGYSQTGGTLLLSGSQIYGGVPTLNSGIQTVSSSSLAIGGTGNVVLSGVNLLQPSSQNVLTLNSVLSNNSISGGTISAGPVSSGTSNLTLSANPTTTLTLSPGLTSPSGLTVLSSPTSSSQILGSGGQTFQFSISNVTAVPEPSQVFLLLMGLMVLFAAGHKFGFRNLS